MDDIAFELIDKTELLQDDWKDKVHGYCYMLDTFDEIASFKVADTYLTKRNIIELMASVLYEASWFGPNQEDLEDFTESLEESSKSEDYDFLAEMKEAYGWEPEIRNKEEEDRPLDLRNTDE